MIQHMTERLAGKIGNANNNAFMLRKLFKMYDTANTGQVIRSGLTWSASHHTLHAAASESQAWDAWRLKQRPAGGHVHCEHTQAVSEKQCACLQIEIEDFRAMSESFGMQLDDDSLLALYSWVSTCSMLQRCSLNHLCSKIYWCSACCCHAALIRMWPPHPLQHGPQVEAALTG